MQDGIFVSFKISSKGLLIITFIILLFFILQKFVFGNENTRIAFSGGFRPVNEPNFKTKRENCESFEETEERIIVVKINRLRKELVIVSDVEEKFKIEYRLKELEAKLKELRS